MSGLVSDVDPDGLLEYSVVYTDRALNHMSQAFQGVMRDISATLKRVHHASAVVVVPGSGTSGMEAVARQFATGQDCLVIRNGWFSFRWSEILEIGGIPATSTVLTARPVDESRQPAFAPPPIEEVLAAIQDQRPDLVFAPHVETSAGMILPVTYTRAVADAAHAVGGLFVLDCIASGAIWVDMEASGVDILVSAPQKSWSGSPCCGLVMLSPRALARLESTTSTSFALDLRKWLEIMQAYEDGGHAYHATMPTDGLRTLRTVISETERYGFDVARAQQEELGKRLRAVLGDHGFKSVAAEGFEAPSVIVSYTDDDGIKTGAKFAALGIQVAAGVPLRCDEPEDFMTFRLGLFGLDKLQNVERTVMTLQAALRQLD